MPLISELVTKLKADTKDFARNIKASENQIREFSSRVAKTGAAIAAAIGVVAVGAFVKLISTINETAHNIDVLAKTSRKLGIVASELQFIQFQANLAGVSTEKLNMGLQRMTRRVSEAAQGLGEAQGALKELGLDAKELAALSPDKQFALIGEALKGVASQSDRVRLGFKLFDSEGVDIINAFTGDVAELREEFEKLGIALTTRQTAAVEKYNDSVTKLSAIWEGFKNQLTAQVSPALEQVVNWIRETIIQMGGLGPLANKVAQIMVSGIQSIVSGVQGLIDILQTLQIKLLQTISIITKLARVGTLGLSSLTGEKILGIDLDKIDERIEKLKQLQAGPGVTAPLQQGLGKVQQTLQAQNRQQIDVRITTEKGLKAEVAESPEVTRRINEIINNLNERSD